MFSHFYSLGIVVIVMLSLPKTLWAFVSGQIPSHYMFEKLGRGLDQVADKSHGGIWFHAVSLGEMKAMAPFVQQMQRRDPHLPLLFSTATITGYREAQKIYPSASHIFLPLDFKHIIEPFVKRVAPRYLFFSETDLWPRLIHAAKEQGAFVAVVSAKISEKSTKRLEKSPMLARYIYDGVDAILCQNREYQRRFQTFVPHPDRVVVTGNLKYDKTFPQYTAQQLRTLQHELGLTRCITIASTHEGEEIPLIRALQPLGLTILLAPRHPQRFDQVAALLEEEHISYTRYSKRFEPHTPSDVILVDAMGMVCMLYALSDVGIVGGSFVPNIGGHNILEPLAYGIPVVFGPYMHNQFEFVEMVSKSASGVQTSMEHVQSAVSCLLDNPSQRLSKGSRGKTMLEEMQGVTQKTLDALLDFDM